VTKTDAFEQRISETLRTKIAQLPPVTMTFDDAPLPSVDEPPNRGRSHVLVGATIVLVVLLLAAGITAAVLSRDDAKQPAGPPTGPVVARLTLKALPSLGFQAKEFTTVAGVNEITLVNEGGTEALVFDDPALSYFRLAAPTGRSVGKVELQAGRDYRIHSFIAGHTAAGVEAVIHVLPAGAPGTPPLPDAVLRLVSRKSTGAEGPAHGEVEYTLANRDDGVRATMKDEVFDQQPVYVFVLRGSFVGNYLRPGPFAPAKPPTARIMTFMVSRNASPMILDSGFGGPEQNLSLLGGAVKTRF
jgi:hypothetical protein